MYICIYCYTSFNCSMYSYHAYLYFYTCIYTRKYTPPHTCILMFTHKSHTHSHTHTYTHTYTRIPACILVIVHTSVCTYCILYSCMYTFICVSYNHEYIILMYVCIYKDRFVRVHHTPSLMHLLHVLAVWSCAVAWSVLSPAAASLARDAVVIARHIEWLGRRPSLRGHSKTGHQQSQRR